MQRERKYRTAWRRVLAALVDSVVLAPLGPIDRLVDENVTQWWLVLTLFLVTSGIAVMYYVAGHALFGMTVGKWICRIQVVDLNGALPGWRRAALRDVVPLLAVAASSVMTTATTISEGISPVAQDRSDPSGAALFFGGILLLWGALELVTMMFNARRRAIHDYIAGTVVVRITNAPRQ